MVSEQYPRGGALMLNAIAGVGMISVGTLGNPAIGAVQDSALAAEVRMADAGLADELIVTRPGLFGDSYAPDPARRATLAPADAEVVATADRATKQATLGKIAILPCIMLVCYLGLIAYFASRGGYRIASIGDKDDAAARQPT